MGFSLSNTAATDQGRPHTISLKLRDTNQLFNSMDPSPFIEKDLDDDAEEFIVSWAQEFSPNAPIKLRIHLDQWPAEDPKELIRTAVHNHFAHRAKITPTSDRYWRSESDSIPPNPVWSRYSTGLKRRGLQPQLVSSDCQKRKSSRWFGGDVCDSCCAGSLKTSRKLPFQIAVKGLSTDF
jgi:hypothetical protein